MADFQRIFIGFDEDESFNASTSKHLGLISEIGNEF
jgi:hypothetical protein